MAKGQKRSNREIKKPKQKKINQKNEVIIGGQVTSAIGPSFGKGKK